MTASAALENFHNSVRTLAQTKRIRVTEFFQDFDKLRSGFVTGNLPHKKLLILNMYIRKMCNQIFILNY